MTRLELVKLLNNVYRSKVSPTCCSSCLRENADIRAYVDLDLIRYPKFFLYQLVMRLVPLSSLKEGEFRKLIKMTRYYVIRGFVSSSNAEHELWLRNPSSLLRCHH